MTKADVVAQLRHINADLTRVKAQLSTVTEAVASWSLPAGAGEYRGPAKVCGACGERLGYGHLDGCPRLPQVDEAA